MFGWSVNSKKSDMILSSSAYRENCELAHILKRIAGSRKRRLEMWRYWARFGLN